MAQFEGTWKLVSSEGWDDYMKTVGVGYLARVAARNTPVTLHITVTGNDVVVRSQSVFKNFTLRFKIGEEFDETTIDGRHFRTVFNFVDGHLIQEQRAIEEKDVDSRIERWLKDGQLYTQLTAGKSKCLRVFDRIEN